MGKSQIKASSLAWQINEEFVVIYFSFVNL